ncbi:MAG: hypothetical protein O7F09_02800, partial [Chloroflexi bacterium]|nr:hypothetical protein [Chloroflexota bacterium]
AMLLRHPQGSAEGICPSAGGSGGVPLTYNYPIGRAGGKRDHRGADTAQEPAEKMVEEARSTDAVPGWWT